MADTAREGVIQRLAHVVDGYLIVLNGSTTCPLRDHCDVLSHLGESYETYVLRHAREHRLGSFELEDAERNLGIWCLYFLHKYVIGNPRLLPDPFWEIHEFVNNWQWHPDDLEMGLWDKARGIGIENCVFRLPEAHQRRDGAEFRRYKEIEIPRGCMKTSTVSKAWVTQRHLRAWFIDQNPYHRTIITSATANLTRQIHKSLRQIWTHNPQIKRLYGITERNPSVTSGKETRRIGILRPRSPGGLDTLVARWLLDDRAATGLSSFSVRVAGVETETTGERADDYVFDDPATKKNSRFPEGREKVKMAFVEQSKQLDQHGLYLVANTRKHLNDFAGTIKERPWRDQFFIMHRRIEWTDPVTGESRLYYPVDGLGETRYSRAELDKIYALSAERDYASELLNWPADPAKALFKREDFKIIARAAAPIEVTAGLTHDVTPEERNALDMDRVQVVAYNSCDPAAKEEQSAKGDETCIVGLRVDRHGAIYVTYIRYGQWASTRVWDEFFLAFCYNNPLFSDYEKPASDLHILPSYTLWQTETRRRLGGNVNVDIRLKLTPMPKTQKTDRIEKMEYWTKHGKFFILEDAADRETIDKFVDQWVNYLVTDHDDGPDATSRLLRYLVRPSYEEAVKAVHGEMGMPLVVEGVAKIPASQILSWKPETNSLWGERGWQ